MLLIVQGLLVFYLLLVTLNIALTVYHKWHFRAVTPTPGRYALVTGASSGLGKETALQLAEKKFPVVLASRSEATLAKLAKEISEAYGVDALFCACDLSSHEGVKKLEKFINENRLVIDILINNAGSSTTRNLTTLSAEEVERVMMLDVAAAVRLTHAIVPQMVERGTGHVMNVSSMAGSLIVPTAAL